jgi:hypothetical protein
MVPSMTVRSDRPVGVKSRSWIAVAHRAAPRRVDSSASSSLPCETVAGVPISWCRFAGLDVTVLSSEVNHSPGHLSGQGSPELSRAAFEAAKCAAWSGSPDYASHRKLAASATATTARTQP